MLLSGALPEIRNAGAILGVGGWSFQPLEAGGLWPSPQPPEARSKILHFFAKITLF